jgi:hypothetical protein
MRFQPPWLLIVVLLTFSTFGHAENDGTLTTNRRDDSSILLNEGWLPPKQGIRTVAGEESTPPRYRALPSDKQAGPIRIAENSDKFEVTLWNIIKESRNPADYEAYLELFPNGRFSERAQKNLTHLKSEHPSPDADRTRGKQSAPSPSINRIGQTYTVRLTANLRQAPSTRSRILGHVRKGAEIFVLGRVADENWYQVLTKAGATAYVSARLIEKQSGATGPSATVSRQKATSANRMPASRDRSAKPAAPDPKVLAVPPDLPLSSPSPSGGQTEAAASPTPDEPIRKSRQEIERHWKRQIELVKESGLYGDCDLVVDNPRTDPAAYSDCEYNNDKIESIRQQMERELLEH